MHKIMILEDHTVTLDWLSQLLTKKYAKAELYRTQTIKDAKTIINYHAENLNLAILDANLPDGNGIELIAKIKKQNKKANCIVFTIFDDDERILQAFLLGADGFILKSSSEKEILDYVSSVLSGAPAISPSVTRKLLRLVRENLGPKSLEVTERLTSREKDILVYIANGYKKKEIGISLELSENTIKEYVKIIYHKLEINSISEATYIALNSGLIAHKTN